MKQLFYRMLMATILCAGTISTAYAENPRVLMKTSLGDINSFMIQGGGFNPDMSRKQGHAPIRNEAQNGLKNVRGSIAMARTSDPHSATSQFFINHVDNDKLDYPSFDSWGYAVFGKVTKGMDTVDKIADVYTITRNGMRNVPEEPVVIENVTRIGNKQ